MSATSRETHSFQAEIAALLKLVTHSLYTNHDVFLRELVSNASDALDRARYQALVVPGFREVDGPPTIDLIADKQRGVFVIEDNGVGMTRDEVVKNLGTIAHSGTLAFLEKAKRDAEEGKKPSVDLIGQFGVGFYSALMVAKRIEVQTLSGMPGSEGVSWSTDGEGAFETGPSDRTTRGTRIELYLKDDQRDFLSRYKVESIVKRYSNYIMHPIRFVERGEDGNEVGERAQINAASAFWTRSSRDLEERDYEEFYKHTMGGFVLPDDKPLGRLHVSLDAPLQFHAVLFVPGRAPADLFQEDRKAIALYAQRVLVIEDCDTLLPSYLRFIRGVVDSADLPLNVSREMLQEHQTVAAIRRQLTRRVLKLLAEIAKEDAPRYDKLWGEFGAVLKEGIHTDNAHRDELVELLRYPTSASNSGLVSLASYVENMPQDQSAIYYAVGDTLDAVSHGPHLERCRAKGHAVLLMTDLVDEWVVSSLPTYKDRPLRSVTQGDLDDSDAAASAPEVHGAFEPLLVRAKEVLGERVRDVRISHRLTTSVSCLVDEAGGLTRNMERLLRMNSKNPPPRRRILELNPDHAFVQKTNALAQHDRTDARVANFIELLFDQANLAEGTVGDPAGVVRRVQSLMDQVAALP